MTAKVDAYTLAVVANFAAITERTANLRGRRFKCLLDARTEKDEQVWWSAEETESMRKGRKRSVETTGLAVQALLQSGEASGTARKALN